METFVKHNRRAAFTLIEMVGVLAVIAILAALLVPKVFAAISDARFANTITSVSTVRIGAMSYVGRYGKFGLTGGISLPVTGTNNWDLVLLTEGLLDRPFCPKLGDAASVEIVPCNTPQGSFNLDGTGALMTSNGAFAVVCVVSNVSRADAYELSYRMSGPSLSATNGPSASANSVGQVNYNFTGNAGDVFIYVTHR